MNRLSTFTIILLISFNYVQCSFVPNIINTGTSAVARSEDGNGNYAFDYNENHSTGGSFRKEKGGPGVQIGSYGLREADGRMRIVNYVADKNGFRASVNSNEHGTSTIDVKPSSLAFNSHTGHHQNGGTFSYSASTSHVAPSLLPNVYHTDKSQSINYGASVNHQISTFPTLQSPSSFSNHHQHHQSYGSVPMTYSTTTAHVAPAYPTPKAISHHHSSISNSLPAYPALAPPPPPTIPTRLPAMPKLVPKFIPVNKNQMINHEIGIAEQNFRSTNKLSTLQHKYFGQSPATLPLIQKSSPTPLIQHQAALPMVQKPSTIPFIQQQATLPLTQHQALPIIQKPAIMPEIHQQHQASPIINHSKPLISTAPAKISAPNGLSIPLSISIHTLG